MKIRYAENGDICSDIDFGIYFSLQEQNRGGALRGWLNISVARYLVSEWKIDGGSAETSLLWFTGQLWCFIFQ